MFIREVKKKFTKDNARYEYIQHRLVESIRTVHGPRQQTILNLGHLSLAEDDLKTLANLIEQNLVSASQTSLFGDAPEELVVLARHFADVILRKRLKSALEDQGKPAVPLSGKTDPVYETIDTNSIVTSDSRTIGAEHIALTQLKELGFFSILERCSLSELEQKQVAAQICARMVHPASERETARWLRNDSALAELLGADFGRLSDQTLHRITDTLCAQKEYIEGELSRNADGLFELDNKVILYDLTNTYFESPKRHSGIAKYGKSKEKRADCPLITLALVVDNRGFPKRSRIVEGNVSEPKTLWDVLEKLEIADGSDDHPRTIVIDAGIATEENLEKLRADKRFNYVAVSRKKTFSQDIFAGATPSSITMSHKKVLEVTIAKHGDETFLLCKSPDRSLKDQAIHVRRREKFEKALSQMNKGLTAPRTRKHHVAIHERIGRIKERYKIGRLYSIYVKEDNNGNAVQIVWNYNADKEKDFGEYLIRTNRNDLADADLSCLHRTLTMIESSFRWLKSDLGLRPNFHQKDPRMSNHATISVLAYFVLAPLLNKLEWGGRFVSSCGKHDDHRPWDKPFGWKGLIRAMSSQTRVTTSFLCKDGLRIDARTTVEPSTEQREIYTRLNVNPKPLKRIIIKN